MRTKDSILVLLITLVCFLIVGQSQLAKGQTKWLGNTLPDQIFPQFKTYWNQVTLQWLGKWAHVQPGSKNDWNDTFIKTSYDYAKANNFPYKQHTFIWRVQDPSWMNGLSQADQLLAIQNWMQTFCTKYPNIDFIDVVNEPLHQTPTYIGALGGTGATGWDWVINAFKLAKQYCPNSKLLLNDYNIVAFETSTTKYLQIINLLNAQNLIHGIGIQCHQLQGAGTIPILKNLYRLAETNLPIYVSQLDLFAANDNQQLLLYQRIFPLLYEHPKVAGVTLWNYKTGQYGVTTQGLLNGTVERAALQWLKDTYFNPTINKAPRAFWSNSSSGLDVNLTSVKSWDFDGTLVSYLWNYDGKTSNQANVSYTFPAAGTYPITLTVTDNGGLTSTFQDTLVVSSGGSSSIDWTKPIAYCRPKFIGSTIKNSYLSPNWDRYWNQATPQYLGKWTSTQPNKDVMDWSGLDFAWNHAKQQGILFKGHTFVWGQQIPWWVAGSGLTSTQQAAQVEQWIKLYCQRYPDPQLIDVVNEPLHQTPNYVNAIGGKGTTGWDWVIWAYTKARQYCPNAKLLINQYDVLNNDVNLQNYLTIINLLKARNLLDGIGQQAHHFQYTSISQLTNNLNTLAATNLPIYISQLDLDIADDTAHLNRMKQLVPLFYQHQSVKGITFWGYVRGQTWLGGSWLYDPNASGSGGSSGTCTQQTLQANIPLTLNVWNDFTVSVPSPGGKIRVYFANDGAANSQTMAVDYAIIDGVTYQAQDQPVNTGVWSGTQCGGSYSEFLHCPGYIEFPKATSSVKVRAKAVDKGSQQMTIKLVTGCTGGSTTTTGLPQQRASLQWLKYTYLPGIASTNKPVASFKYTVSGMTVSFDASASFMCNGSIVLYSWSFNDTSTGSLSKVDHTFSSANTYNVTLTILSDGGLADSITQSVQVGTAPNNPPTASFTVSQNGLSVTVNGINSKDTDGTIQNYLWVWGDSSTNTSGASSSASHTYSSAGTYTIRLIVTDNQGANATLDQSVTVNSIPNAAPTANFYFTINSLTVTFTSSSTDSDGFISSYSWDLGNGATNTNQQFTYTYPNAGTYNVKLTVTDNGTATNSVIKSVTVQVPVNQAPVCNIGSCSVWYLQVNCNSASTDDVGIVNYSWSWSDGQTTSGSNYQSVQHNYATANTYNIQLNVTDAGGLSSVCSKSVTTTNQAVANNPPISKFGFYADALKLNFWFEGWDSDGSVVSYLWNFGDGTTQTSNAPTHTFPSAKTYTVTLTVTDDKGATGTSSQSIVVTNPPKNFHIETLSKAVIKVGSSYFGQLTVKVFDNTGKPVSSVVVSGQISHPPSNLWDNVSGTTNANGIAILQNSTPRTSLPYINACAYSFQYTGTLGLWYNSGDNKVTNTCI